MITPDRNPPEQYNGARVRLYTSGKVLHAPQCSHQNAAPFLQVMKVTGVRLPFYSTPTLLLSLGVSPRVAKEVRPPLSIARTRISLCVAQIHCNAQCTTPACTVHGGHARRHPRIEPRLACLRRRILGASFQNPPRDQLPHAYPTVHPAVHLEGPCEAHVGHHPLVLSPR